MFSLVLSSKNMSGPWLTSDRFDPVALTLDVPPGQSQCMESLLLVSYKCTMFLLGYVYNLNLRGFPYLPTQCCAVHCKGVASPHEPTASSQVLVARLPDLSEPQFHALRLQATRHEGR